MLDVNDFIEAILIGLIIGFITNNFPLLIRIIILVLIAFIGAIIKVKRMKVKRTVKVIV